MAKTSQKLTVQDKLGIVIVKYTLCQTDDGKIFVLIKLKDLSFSFHSSDIW